MKVTMRITMVIAMGLAVAPAEAGYVVDLTEQGSDVVATGGGVIDLTGLSFGGSVQLVGAIVPNKGRIWIGQSSFAAAWADQYDGFTGPTSFGDGGYNASVHGTGSGDALGIDGAFLDVPLGYHSGNPLSSMEIYQNQTFASLGVTPGTYEWTWGTGPDQNFTLVIGRAVTAVPEASTWVMTGLGFAGLGFMGYAGSARRRRSAPAV